MGFHKYGGKGAQPHKIELSDLQEFVNKEEVVFASSTLEKKKLCIDLRGTYIVYVGHNSIHRGTQPFAAVEAYNAITEKYVDPDAERLKNFKL